MTEYDRVEFNFYKTFINILYLKNSYNCNYYLIRESKILYLGTKTNTVYILHFYTVLHMFTYLHLEDTGMGVPGKAWEEVAPKPPPP